MTFQRRINKNFFASQRHFPACKTQRLLLDIKTETAMTPPQGGRIFLPPACSSVDQKRQTPQAGDFVPGLVEGSRHPIHCGFDGSEPQDADCDKMKEGTTLAIVGKKISFSAHCRAFSRFAPRFFEGKPRRKKTKTNLRNTTESIVSI
jgi:hypothetical protein